ncbi:Concanavalin A-like lectin/glucanase, subgroup [Cynara cardunculus var. scolymus]|uniref:Concanavalin A-like lectin/glucanase, subgroup n=1 Tax=Cynara cardunculus var. scolymus TaxID=59895 RepID=A0A103XST2_CYNCS|nr:Concanavalin A-like lectin/glucanase, subgroup [Cynara cardunculus var. scolymus]
MTKSKNFFRSIIKPFTFTSNQESQQEDLGAITAQDQKVFSFQTLVSATRNFHPDNKLGQGGFGPVFKNSKFCYDFMILSYKIGTFSWDFDGDRPLFIEVNLGKLENGEEIAVKQLSRTSNQGKKEFVNEARLLARVQHRNVVSLLGYCVSPEKLLVYEYVPNESLDKLLFKRLMVRLIGDECDFVDIESENRNVLDWKRRYDIITGVARGLLYLHEDAHDCIIHRDIKASNILLDEKWVPKIADFGMAKLYPEDQTHINTRVAGTNGYMAPEYVMHGKLSIKADVYSFGVVVLELISGQKNYTFNLDPECQNLLDWAYKMYKKGKGLEILESILASSADPDQVATCIKLGLLCTQFDHHLRPTMSRAALMLTRKPGTLEEPTRPGYLGSRQRRAHGIMTSSTDGMSNSQTRSHSNYSTSSTTTTAMAASNRGLSARASSDRHHRHRGSTSRSAVSDPYGKRPMQE